MARPEVARHLVGSERTTAPYVTPAELMIVPVLEEVLVVQKQLAFKEELPIWRRAETGAVEVPVSL
jgi:stress response protein YsnF